MTTVTDWTTKVEPVQGLLSQVCQSQDPFKHMHSCSVTVWTQNPFTLPLMHPQGSKGFWQRSTAACTTSIVAVTTVTDWTTKVGPIRGLLSQVGQSQDPGNYVITGGPRIS